jgi:hypothetical protein
MSKDESVSTTVAPLVVVVVVVDDIVLDQSGLENATTCKGKTSVMKEIENFMVV